MQKLYETVMVFVIIACATAHTQASAPSLGSANTFAVLAGTTVTNTGSSVIDGNVGVSPGSATTGFPPGAVTPPFTIHNGDAVAAQAEADTLTAYNALAATPYTQDLTGTNLGGLTLTPGVYRFDSSAQLTGALTLTGNSNADFIFEIGSTLTTASASSVNLINGASANNVFWQIGSSATLGTNTAFAGNLLADTSITLNTGTTLLDGRALALNGGVTMDSNTITAPVQPVPETATINVFVFGLLAISYALLRARKPRISAD